MLEDDVEFYDLDWSFSPPDAEAEPMDLLAMELALSETAEDFDPYAEEQAGEEGADRNGVEGAEEVVKPKEPGYR